jgi:hypothetical protein
MKGWNTLSRRHKLAAGAAIAGFAFVSLFCKLNGVAAQCWSHLDGRAWVALQVLSPLIRVGWQFVTAYLHEDSGCFQHLPEIVACAWRVLFAIAG